MKIVNATPHPISIMKGEELISFPKSEFIARVSSEETTIESELDFIVVEQTFGDVTGLPKEEAGTVYIVSAMVLSANKVASIRRSDLIAPNTGATAIRNDLGHIVAVRSFVK
ncbi:MAG: hypothetical protein ACRCZ9_08845 [Fusobacteriaceae bacterium]